MTQNPDSLAAFLDQAGKRFPVFRIFLSSNDAEFDDALEEILEEAVVHMERNANHLAPLDEDSITAFFVSYLSMPGILRALQQAHTKGHVDITIELDRTPTFRRLGEAKIYNGPGYHKKGLEQLVSRYSTGRDTCGLLLEYVKLPGIKQLVDKVRSYMDEDRPFSQCGTTEDHRIRWAFVTRHLHSSGELVRVIHLNFNLYFESASSGIHAKNSTQRH